MDNSDGGLLIGTSLSSFERRSPKSDNAAEGVLSVTTFRVPKFGVRFCLDGCLISRSDGNIAPLGITREEFVLDTTGVECGVTSDLSLRGPVSVRSSSFGRVPAGGAELGSGARVGSDLAWVKNPSVTKPLGGTGGVAVACSCFGNCSGAGSLAGVALSGEASRVRNRRANATSGITS
jgi:hypothetical protein